MEATIVRFGVVATSFVASGFLLYATIASPLPQKAKVATPEQAAFFETKVRPIFIAKCQACHGEKEQIADLRLDRPLSPEMVKLVAEAVHYNGDTKMPPSGKLSKQDIQSIATWAKQGGPWPAKIVVKPKKKFWAFIPPTAPVLPKVKNTKWAKSELDLFVLQKLESKGLQPAPQASKAALIRRATFDLTGLPPTPAEIDAFLADTSANAFEKVLDRLLATPAYGERWGRHWLDVARYADSNGLDENLVYRNAWRYRDWVIESINKDLPIQQFLQEQVAGDLMPGASDDQIVATGYLALGGKMLAEDDPQKQELDIIDEQVDTLSKGMLAMTVGCARCHDHKFDPISAKDYYSMAGIFKSTKTMDKFTVVAEWQERPIGPKQNHEKLRQIQLSVQEKAKKRDAIRAAARQQLTIQLQSQKSQYIAAAENELRAQKEKVNLKPVLSARDGSLMPGSVLVEAESFATGNVRKDSKDYGSGIGVIHNGGTYPNFAEYLVEVPETGNYQLDLRYASGDQRSIKVSINGQLALPMAASTVTSGFYPAQQRWIAEGIVSLRAGTNTIRFERSSYFPHIDRWLLTPRPGSRTTVIEANGLIADLVSIVANQLSQGVPVKLELPENADHLLPVDQRTEIQILEKEIEKLEASKPSVPLAMAVSEGTAKNLKVHLRGSYLTLGADTQRGIPAVLASQNPISIPKDKSGRLELAKWIASPKNPLTARVFVNRVWRWKFGRGIVGSVDNFGILGELPTHPELLDWLATQFVSADRWSLKKFQKRIMLSSTYQMSTQFNSKAANLDPENHYLWRFNRKRLEAEAIRDSIFFVAGQLDRKMGGTMLNLPARAYVTDTGSRDALDYNVPRRSVYLPVIRAAVYDVYTAFDFGDPTVMNGDRPSTTVAPQALFMMNAPIVLKATRSMAEKLLQKKSWNDAQRVQSVYRSCLGRSATPAEITRSLDYLNKFKAAYQRAKVATSEVNAWQSLCKSIVASNEFIYVE